MSKAMTKAQLVDENIRLRAECERLETELASVCSQRAAPQRAVSQYEVVGSYVKAGQVFEKRRAWEGGRRVVTHVCMGAAQ